MYDAIIIGARCAGASTAMLLARQGLRVLLVDRAKTLGEVPRGHFIHRQGPRLLAEWGLLDRVLDTNCPAVTTFTSDFGDFRLTGEDVALDDIPFGVAPRHAVIDNLLMEAAAEAGAEIRLGFAVHELLSDSDRITGVRGRDASGAEVSERASIVVGADGRNSLVARSVEPEEFESIPTLCCWYFSYWSGIELGGLEHVHREGNVMFAHPTNDGLTALFIGWPISELGRVRADIDGSAMAALGRAPELAERFEAGRREERYYGATQLPNFLRRPFGPGWALVGDAGCHKDPYLALGICDALRDAGFLADAIGTGLGGPTPLEDALERYERRRNEATLPMYRQNAAAAQLGGLPAELMAVRAAVRGNREDTRHLYLAREGLVPEGTFFNEENLGRLMGAAAAAPARA
jgi:flavin-dependent dehydrogenase